jgi:ferredoxin
LALINVSKGNSKLGKVHNISVLPVVDCTNCRDCASSCYARKFVRLYPAAKRAWTANSGARREDPDRYFEEIREHLRKKAPKLWRWHVSGDVTIQAHADQIVSIAREFPGTRFMIYTKNLEVRWGRIPENLAVRWSQWKDVPVPRYYRKFPKFHTALAGIYKGSLGLIGPKGKTAIQCPHEYNKTVSCEECLLCWDKSLDIWTTLRKR